LSGFAIEQIQEQMRQLKLVRTAELLPLLLQDASKAEVSYSEFLAELLGRELAAKQERHTAMKTTMARFPFQKSLESFDF
jgi:DNA replication protein DnaC